MENVRCRVMTALFFHFGSFKFLVMRKILAVFTSCLFLLSSISAQTVQLVKDINPSGASSPNLLFDYNSTLLFLAGASTSGNQLWKSDGTNEGTVMVKDINPGGYCNIMNLTAYNGKAYFEANDGVRGKELWMTDGTESGTQLVKDVNSSGDGTVWSPIVFNNFLFFSADDGTNGREWWLSDGTQGGTHLFTDSNTTGSGGPGSPYIFNSELYFNYNNGTTGRELWKTNGTPAGTQMVKDINLQTPAGSVPQHFIEYNGKLYFGADDGLTGRELWVTDGTTSGTQMVKNINPTVIGSDPKYLILYNNLLYFAANDGTNGTELWVTDGTSGGTQIVKDINPSGGGDILNLAVYNNKLFFSATDGANGREPWISDGTSAGTQMLKDINSSGNSMRGYFNFSPVPAEYAGNLFFMAEDGSNGAELWLTDGSETGTRKIEPAGATGNSPLDMNNGMVISNGAIYFAANYDGNGNELYRVVDGSIGIPGIAHTRQIFTLFPNPASNTVKIKIMETRSTVTHVLVYDFLGNVVIETEIAANKDELLLEVGALVTGIYLCEVLTKENRSHKKLIVAK